MSATAMMDVATPAPDVRRPEPRIRVWLRVGWALSSFAAIQVLVCGLAVLPVALALRELLRVLPSSASRVIGVSLAILPSYAIFALLLMTISATTNWLAGWRTPVDARLAIREFGWPLLIWVRYMIAIRIVNVLAGTLFCGSPIWTVYLRVNGARIGRRVIVNSLYVSDHNLLEFGDDVIIGSDVHLSGHTVEGGVVKTGRVRLGRGATIGLGTVVDIDVEAGERCQVGALSLVPKHARLDGGAVYVGVPVRRLR